MTRVRTTPDVDGGRGSHHRGGGGSGGATVSSSAERSTVSARRIAASAERAACRSSANAESAEPAACRSAANTGSAASAAGSVGPAACSSSADVGPAACRSSANAGSAACPSSAKAGSAAPAACPGPPAGIGGGGRHGGAQTRRERGDAAQLVQHDRVQVLRDALALCGHHRAEAGLLGGLATAVLPVAGGPAQPAEPPREEDGEPGAADPREVDGDAVGPARADVGGDLACDVRDGERPPVRRGADPRGTPAAASRRPRAARANGTVRANATTTAVGDVRTKSSAATWTSAATPRDGRPHRGRPGQAEQGDQRQHRGEREVGGLRAQGRPDQGAQRGHGPAGRPVSPVSKACTTSCTRSRSPSSAAGSTRGSSPWTRRRTGRPRPRRCSSPGRRARSRRVRGPVNGTDDDDERRGGAGAAAHERVDQPPGHLAGRAASGPRAPCGSRRTARRARCP